MSNDNSRSRANSSLSNILTDILSRDQSTVLDTSLSELAEEEEVPKEETSRSRRGLTRNAAVTRLANHSSYSNISSSVDMESLDSFVMDDDRLIPNRSHSIRTTDSSQSGSATIDRSLSARSKRQQKDRLLLHGVKQFNLDPQKGLKLLEERGFLEMTPESVAQFLFRQERLSKKQIGTFLGSHQDFNKEVLSIFVNLHQFSHLLLVQALRQFLWSFRLPGEAMQIDRVMDSFAAHYCAQNPNIFEERDTCFILSFSIIMLNTALHNPNAKIKISAEQFVKQNRGINSGRDLPNDMLEAIYRNIKEEPFKIPDETYDDLMYTFFSPEREGWLEKQGGNWKNWKRRWFVLNDRCLYYFQHTAENAPKGIIPLEGVKVRPLPNKNGKDWVFEIFSDSGSEVVKGCKTDSHGAVVQGNHKHYRMAAATQEERDQWMSAIEDSIEDNPFCRIIEEKKASRRHMELNGS
jgi:cytohesin